MTITGYLGWPGLFGTIAGGTVKNVNVTNVYIVSSSKAGAIVGMNSGGTIENCTASGIISVYVQRGFSYNGGIVGENSGSVDSCTFSGSVFSSSSESTDSFLLDTFPYAGGVVGYNGGEVLNSSSNGRVSSYPYHGAAGGIAGRNEGTVARCKSGSDVSSHARGPDAGGVVGYNFGEVLSSSSSGSVSSYNSNNTWYATAGGIVARNDKSGSVENCFKTSGKIIITNTKSQYAFAGGIIGVLSDGAKTMSNTFSRTATGQQWGIGYDRGNGPSNDGATPTD
jgi:hypothetical protein